MKKLSFIVIAFILVLMSVLASSSSSFVTESLLTRAFANGSISWTGQGTTSGSLDTVECDDQNTAYLLWVFTLGGGTNTITSATLSLGGSGSGSYTMVSSPGNQMKATTPFFTLGTLTASVSYVGNLGTGNANLVISHGCPGGGITPTPTVTVTPTVTPSVTPSVTVSPTPTTVPSATPTPTVPVCDQGQTYDPGLHICISCPGGGDCEVVIGTPTPTVEVTPTETPSVTVTPTPTTTTTTSQNNDGGSSNGGTGGGEVASASTEAKQGEVLGASTIAATGDFKSVLATIEQGLGAMLASLGFVYGKKKVKKNK